MVADTAWPRWTRDYQGHVIDGRRWDRYVPRDDDVIVATAYKAGTTWMQAIVANLIFQGEPLPAPVMELGPWIDMRFPPLDETLAMLARQDHRRTVKTHLALDGLRFFPGIKYIYVGRDPRDIFMSMWNHHRSFTPEARQRFLDAADVIGIPWPDCPDDPRVFWRDWMTRAIFPWESDGYPYWSVLHHVDSWWRYRHLPNILFVHYNDLLADLDGQMRRVAAYLDIAVADDLWPKLVDAATFQSMRANAGRIMGRSEGNWQGGGKTFFHKGTNQRWRAVLDEADLALYREAIAAKLEPACTAWLEHGGSTDS